MTTLADRIRASREQWVTVGGKEYLLRRPTKLQLANFFSNDERPWVEVVFLATVGWKLIESDLWPGGAARPVAFDADAFREFAADHEDLLLELTQRVRDMIDAHEKRLEEVEKN